MKKISLLPITLIALFALSACSSAPNSVPDPSCTKEYIPVCGKVQVECVKAPCPPIDSTFSNRCEAENAKATDIVTGTCEENATKLVSDCLSNKGTWLYESNECEGIPKEACEKIGGTFNECASACRNEVPKPEACTMQCVIVCQFSA